ncbi:MAG: type transport system ATP-binding protein [Actinomycetota bacterium]|nr:type transport system ATP-binding protein [Actinomycetota bacterium]
MGAARFIGRVGGLAVALGVGVAVSSGHGVAFADVGDSGAADSARSGSPTDSAGAPSAAKTGPARATRGTAASRSAGDGSGGGNGGSDGPAASTRTNLVAAPAAAATARSSAKVAPASTIDPPQSAVGLGSVSGETDSAATATAGAVAAAEVSVPEPVAAEADSVTTYLVAADDRVSDDAGTNPLGPAVSPMAWALLSVARRETIAAAAVIDTPVASVVGTEQSNNGVTVAPTLELVNGVIQGALNATSERGLPMTYTFAGSSAGGKMDIGNVPVTPSLSDPQSYTILPYANWLDSGVKGSEQFSVRVSEVTDFDAFLTGIPLVGDLLFKPIIGLLQELPLISTLLAPIIGGSIVAAIDVAVNTLAPADTPVAFTYKVTSFDGVQISTNFFPASGLVAGEDAPTALNSPGLGGAGRTNPYDRTNSQSYQPSVRDIRDAGYNLITWDPRGEFASGGVLQLDNPFYEGRDVSAIVSWSATDTPAQLNGPDDPKVGMVGGSYGGGIQMTTIDPRIDAIVPGIAWHSLNEALYPNDIFKSAWSVVLGLSLVTAGATINNQIYAGVATGLLFNWVSQTAQAVLGSSGPTALLNEMKAPTMFVQGTVDALFPLNQAIQNAQTILANPFGTEVKMTWFCGGHGYCLDPVNPTQTPRMVSDTIAWLDTYVAGTGDPAEDIPVFQWYDQKGVYHQSDLLPFDPGFNEVNPFSADGTGGLLPIIPLIGGSGPLQGTGLPSSVTSWPLNQVFATEANNAVNVAVTPNVGDQFVGTPELTLTYTGLGTGKAVFAQLVDDATGRVVGNISTAVPVTLDGRERTVTIPMQSIAYTAGAGDSLTLQIAAYSTLYSNSSIGLINISDIQLDLPVRATV